MMTIINKLKNFVATLSDAEIEGQLKDIFEWAKTYKELMECEQSNRRKDHVKCTKIVEIENPVYDEELDTDEDTVYDGTLDTEDEPLELPIAEETIDYYLAQMIQEKVSNMAIEETQKQLMKLRGITETNLFPNEIAQLHYEIEACELHLFELTGIESNSEQLCSACGNPLEENAKFCAKCGKQI